VEDVPAEGLGDVVYGILYTGVKAVAFIGGGLLLIVGGLMIATSDCAQ
jgi:hypothetical protein